MTSEFGRMASHRVFEDLQNSLPVTAMHFEGLHRRVFHRLVRMSARNTPYLQAKPFHQRPLVHLDEVQGMTGPFDSHRLRKCRAPFTKKDICGVLLGRIMRLKTARQDRETPIEALAAGATMMVARSLLTHAGATDGNPNLVCGIPFADAPHDIRLGQPLVPVFHRTRVVSNESDESPELLERKRVRSTGGHGADDLWTQRQVVAYEAILEEVYAGSIECLCDRLPEGGEQKRPRPLRRVLCLVVLASREDMNRKHPVPKPLAQILAEAFLRGDHLLSGSMCDKDDSARRGFTQDVQCTSKGVEPAGEEDDVLGAKGWSAGIKPEKRLALQV